MGRDDLAWRRHRCRAGLVFRAPWQLAGSAMSGSRLSNGDAVALFVDLHEHGLGAMRSVTATALRRGVGRLAALATLYELPILLSGMPLPDPTFIRELGAGDAPVRVRTTASAFDDPAMREEIDRHGRRAILLPGVASEGSIVLTALGARDAGHDVFVVVDACGGIDPRSEQAAFQTLAAAGVTLTSTWTLGLGMQHDLAAPRGRDLLALVGGWLNDRRTADALGG